MTDDTQDRGIFARKPLEAAVTQSEHTQYRRVIGKWSLLSLGIAAIIGAGIFAGIGPAVKAAGPAVIFAFVIAGLACIFSAFAYGELAALIPGSGSAYTYIFTAMGRMPAFVTAWWFVLYIVVGNMFIATGWSQYFNAALDQLGIPLPASLQASILESPTGGFNLPASLIMVLVTILVILGIRESVRVENALVVFKVTVIAFFIAVGLAFIHPTNWQPLAPSGVGGVAAAMGAAFFSYVGFEAVTTVAEESQNPRKDLPFAVIGSVSISMLLFILVALVLTGMVPLGSLDENAPLARAFQAQGIGFAGAVVISGALVATTTVLIAFQMSLPRVFQAVARDGFLPEGLAKIHPRFRTPVRVAVVGGAVTAIGAGIMPPGVILDVEVLSVLPIYMLVCVAVLVLKVTHPDAPRRFRTNWALPILGFVACGGIFAVQPVFAQMLFAAWTGLGLMLYGFYGHRKFLRQAATRPSGTAP